MAVELVPVIYDPQSDAQTYALCAKRLMIEDGITMIFGCYTSSSRKVVLPVVERLNGLLWYPTLYEGFEFSSNVIYTGAAPNQNSVALLLLPCPDLWPTVLFRRLGLCLPASNRTG